MMKKVPLLPTPTGDRSKQTATAQIRLWLKDILTSPSQAESRKHRLHHTDRSENPFPTPYHGLPTETSASHLRGSLLESCWVV